MDRTPKGWTRREWKLAQASSVSNEMDDIERLLNVLPKNV
jgi:hypothetical protein